MVEKAQVVARARRARPRRRGRAARRARCSRSCRQRGSLRARRHRRRRRRDHRLHVRHDRDAEGLRALPPRPAGDVRHVRARVLDPQPSDVFSGTPPLAFTFGLGALVLFPLRFGASTAPVAKPGRPARRDPRARRHDAVHRADRVPRAARARTSRTRCTRASRRASRCPRACRTRGTRRPASGSSTGSARPRCCTSSSPRRPAEARPGSCGRPVPGYEARIVGEDMQTLPPGAVGKLAVRGPTGCRYLDDPRQSAYVRDGWNLTGDAFSMDADGYFWFQARTDDMIISSGYNISGFEVEAALLEHPLVAECAVVAAPDDERGHVVMAYVVASRAGRGARAAGPRQGADRALQVPAPDRVRRRAAAHADGQGPAQRAAGARVVRRLQPPGWPEPRGYANGIEAVGPARVRRRPDRLGRDRRVPAADLAGPGAAGAARTSSPCSPRPAPGPSTSRG